MAPEQRPRWTRWKPNPTALARLRDAARVTCAYPTRAVRHELARELGVTPRRVQVWFQNQRQRKLDAQRRAHAVLARSVWAAAMHADFFGDALAHVRTPHDAVRVAEALVETASADAVRHMVQEAFATMAWERAAALCAAGGPPLSTDEAFARGERDVEAMVAQPFA